MSWSGGTYTRSDGVFTGSGIWASNRDAGTKIVASRHDTHDQDLATGINSCLNKDGSNAATGALNMGSQKISSLADGVAHTDALNLGQLQDGYGVFQATDSGSANTYAIALTPAVTGYVAGQMFTFKAANANTGASTLNVNALGTKDLKKNHDVALASGDIEQYQLVTAVYDGTRFQVISQLANAPGSMTSWTLSGDSGSNQTIADGNTVDIAGGTGIDTTAGSTDTVTVAIDSTVVQKTVQNTFSKAQIGSLFTATLASVSGVLDYDTYNNFIVTLASGSNTLAAVTTEASQVGQSGVIVFIQPSSSSAATLSLHGDYETAGGSGITLSSANNAYDILPYFIKADNSILLGAPQLAFA